MKVYYIWVFTFYDEDGGNTLIESKKDLTETCGENYMKDIVLGWIDSLVKWMTTDNEGKEKATLGKKLVIGFFIMFILIIILVIIWMFSDKNNFFEEHYQPPLFSMCEEGENDYIKADISLREGKIIVTPLLAVQYDGKILQTIRVAHYYNDNETVLITNNEGKSYFSLEVDELQRKKLIDAAVVVKELLNERNQEEEFEVETVYLADIMYQNIKSDKSQENNYWYFSLGETGKIKNLEKELWKPEYELDLDGYEIDGFKYNNSQLIMIVNGCMEAVKR